MQERHHHKVVVLNMSAGLKYIDHQNLEEMPER